MAEQHKCCAHKWSGWQRIQCSKNGKIEREGKHYCGTHDPVAVAAKNKARNAKWDAEWKAKADTEAAAATKQQELERNAARYLFLLNNAQFSYDEHAQEHALVVLVIPEPMTGENWKAATSAYLDYEIAKGKKNG